MSSSEEESVVSNEEVSNEGDSEEEEAEDVVEAKPVKAKRTRKTKKGKKKKDPNKPKRNMSAFFLYSTANRATIKEENPDLAFGELAKLISTRFKELDDKERKKWEKKAEKDKARYLEEMKNYVAPVDSSESDEESDDGAKKNKKKRKKTKDPNKPKRNMSAFFLYSCANRATIKSENPDATFGDLAKIISNKFKSLPEKELKKWEKKAAKDKARYEQEMEAYKEKN